MMRISGGEFRGRTLLSPKTTLVRPSSSRLREAVFNICQGEVEDAHMLDLFCGSGLMGLEALSRGAVSVVAVDNAKSSLDVAKRNAELLGVSDKFRARGGDVLKVLDSLIAEKAQFELIYCDPPYQKGKVAVGKVFLGLASLKKVAESELCVGRLFVEDSALAPYQLEEGARLGRLVLKSKRLYGDSCVYEWLREDA